MWMKAGLCHRIAVCGLALGITLSASSRPAIALVAAPSAHLEPTVPLGIVEPTRLGYSAVLNDEPRLNYEVALGLTYGLPLAILYGSQVLRASAGPSWDLPVLMAAFGSLTAGYVYVGEPMRGVAVLAGEGAAVAATLVAYSLVKLIPAGPPDPSRPPELVDTGVFFVPILTLAVCELIKAQDLRRIVDEKNRDGGAKDGVEFAL